jgi:restriction system protein
MQAVLQHHYYVSGAVQIAAQLNVRGEGTNVPPPPSVVLSAIIIPEAGVSDGVLVADVGIAWYEILAVLQRDPTALHQFSPRQWEEILAAAYKRQGFDEVILTPSSNDRGRDVIASKRGFGAIRILDQMKAYSPDHLVPANDVRAMIGVLNLDRRASKALVTTTSGFAPGVMKDPDILALMPTRLELKDGPQLTSWLQGLAIGVHKPVA